MVHYAGDERCRTALLIISLKHTLRISALKAHITAVRYSYSSPSPTLHLPDSTQPLLAALCFRHRLVSLELDEQRNGAAHRLDNGETLQT